MPGTPISSSSSGPAMSATVNDRPIVMPIMAMAFVRCDSRVRSASNAITTPATAPLPCRARPSTTSQMSVARAASALPTANSSRPATITGLRPIRSDAMPKGICRSAWVRP